VPVVRLKGLNRNRKRLKDGSFIVYWYAWKGGPRLDGEPGSPEFIASFAAAVKERKAPRNDNLAGLVADYRASPEFAKLADSTRAEWSRWLDRIAATQADSDIGALPVSALDDHRVKAEIGDWRNQWSDRPRTADYGMQVLSRVLKHAISRGKLRSNHAEGFGQLYTANRADQIWTQQDIAAYCARAKSAEVGFIVRLACLTGLRRDDLRTLAWSHVFETSIRRTTAKTKTEVSIPLIAETRALLAEIRKAQEARHAALCVTAQKKGCPEPPRCLTVLSNTRGRPWSVDGLEHQVIDTKKAAGVDKHLHDARGTFATRLRKSGMTAVEIADVMGWEGERVGQILARYVDREAIVSALVRRMDQNESGASAPNFFPTVPEE
jgi:integrase